jgi:leucyl aminopeptidase
MGIYPDLKLPRITQTGEPPTRTALESLDHLVVILPIRPKAADYRRIPQAKQIEKLLAKTDAGSPVISRLSNRRSTGVTAAKFADRTRFEALTWARKLVATCRSDKPARIGLYAPGLEDAEKRALTALVAAALAAAFKMPSFQSKPRKDWSITSIKIFGVMPRLDLDSIRAQAIGNNVARWFTALPPNALDAKAYRRALQALAKEFGLGYEFLDDKKLSSLGAGAFLAVAQGNEHHEAGIVRLRYRPHRQKRADLALVGKGILFDTGGTNLKPFEGMLDMHTDMQGSAVALGSLVALAQLEVPYAIDAWLAITENRTSATAYKPQDVITACNGTTIQVIHTDAEGRMVLADTLALATKEQPAVVIDYATLTGACVRALTESYSGIFCNHEALNAVVHSAGVASGERVWPFPMDADYDELIKSEIADVKQCAASGSGDHILAARFLSRFVPDSVPWVHVDLSAGHHDNGLAHIPTKITGFGVGLTLELLNNRTPAALAKEIT